MTTLEIINSINSFDYGYEYSGNNGYYSRMSNLKAQIKNELAALSEADLYEVSTQISTMEFAGQMFEILLTAKKPVASSFRSKVFARAYEIRKATSEGFAVCLSKAWNLYRLAKRMAHETVSFTYKKMDGSLRKAVGTLNNLGHAIKGTGKSSPKAFRYWDIQANAFRSFNANNLISIF